MARQRPTTIEVSCPDCGAIFDWMPVGPGKPRSPEQHRRYFCGISLVYKAWPETHPEQFDNAELFRQWIQMKAGFREVDARIPLNGIEARPAYRLVKAILQTGDRLKIPVVHNGEMIVWRAQSISFLKMGHLKFCALNNATDDVIKEETGLVVQELIDDYFKMRETMKRDLSGRERAPRHIGEEWMT